MDISKRQEIEAEFSSKDKELSAEFEKNRQNYDTDSEHTIAFEERRGELQEQKNIQLNNIQSQNEVNSKAGSKFFKLLKHPFFYTPAGLVIGSLILVYIFGISNEGTQPNDTKKTVEILNSVLNQSPIFQDSPGAYLEINENKLIPYTHQFRILEGKFGEKRWEEIYNVKFLLPNNKYAFLPVLKEGEKYIIASTLEDCSDITVSEAYQIPDNFDESNVCFTKKLFCSEDEKNIELDPILNEIDAYKKALNKSPQREESLFRNLYEIISYSFTEESLYYPMEKCVKFKK